jgi:ABC-type uncharacterized transport system ATPase subunit
MTVKNWINKITTYDNGRLVIDATLSELPHHLQKKITIEIVGHLNALASELWAIEAGDHIFEQLPESKPNIGGWIDDK